MAAGRVLALGVLAQCVIYLTIVQTSSAFSVQLMGNRVGGNDQRSSSEIRNCVLFLRTGPHAATTTRAVATGRSLRSPVRMTVETSERVQKILPLYDGRNLIIGENGWFLESSTGSDELSGDFVVPLEMNDPERGEFTEWILYKDGEVITTVTEDEIDSANDALLGMSGTSLTNPIGADLRSGPVGFVLGALASMVDLFGNDNAGRDSGTAFRFFGNLIPGLRANEKDDTWALWDMQRASKPLATPTTGRAKEGMLDVASAPAADKVLPSGEDAQWVAARREGTMLLREAEATMKQGDCDAAALMPRCYCALSERGGAWCGSGS